MFGFSLDVMRIAKLALENPQLRDKVLLELGICDDEQEAISQELVKNLVSERPVLAIFIQPAGEQIEVSGFQGNMKAGMVHQETKLLAKDALSPESLKLLGL
jgi:hypothetical protein